MRKWLTGLAGLLAIILFSGCDYDEPDFMNVRNVRVIGMQDGKLHAEFTVDCDNPNGFGFKVKRSLLNVYVDDNTVGVIELDDKVKIKRKSLRTYTVPVAISVSPFGLIGVMKSIKKDKIQIRFQGNVRGSVWGFAKSFPVDEKRTVDASMFKDLQGILQDNIPQ